MCATNRYHHYGTLPLEELEVQDLPPNFARRGSGSEDTDEGSQKHALALTSGKGMLLLQTERLDVKQSWIATLQARIRAQRNAETRQQGATSAVPRRMRFWQR